MIWNDKRKRLIRRFALTVLGILVVGLVVSWFFAGWLVSPHPMIVGSPPPDFPARTITLESDSGSKIAAWHVRSNDSKGVVVLLHPIRGSRLSMVERARMLCDAGYSIVMIDLQAHGESPGAHITVGHLEKHDARAAVEFARQQHPNEPIGVIAVSLGGGATLLASPLGIDALVLESVYPNVSDAVHNRVKTILGPMSYIPAELLLLQLRFRLGISPSELRPIDHLPRVGCPVCVISGIEDRHTTATETIQMFSAAGEPKELWLVDGAAHEDLYSASPKEYKARIIKFLDEHMRKRK